MEKMKRMRGQNVGIERRFNRHIRNQMINNWRNYLSQNDNNNERHNPEHSLEEMLNMLGHGHGFRIIRVGHRRNNNNIQSNDNRNEMNNNEINERNNNNGRNNNEHHHNRIQIIMGRPGMHRIGIIISGNRNHQHRGHAINDFPEIEIEDLSKLEESNRHCVICLEDFKPKEKVTALPCIHFFHTPCIKNWIKNNKTCPICKFELTEENLAKKIKENSE